MMMNECGRKSFMKIKPMGIILTMLAGWAFEKINVE